jgi:hypothetical protein
MKIKNTTISNITLVGTVISPSAYYSIVESERSEWANDDEVLIAISSGNCVMNNGVSDIVGINDQLSYIKNNLAVNVKTQKETDKIVLKMSCAKKLSSTGGLSNIQIKIPGTNNPTGDTSLDGRFVDSGFAYFEGLNIGDHFTVKIVDVDNISGAGAGYVVGSYTEDYSAETSNTENDGGSGWYAGKDGGVGVESLGYFGFIGSGYYMVVEGQTKSGTQDTLYVNVKWGKMY